MADVAFDTLAVTRQLESKGFSSDQAEAITEAVRVGVTGGVASRADVAELRADVAELRTDLRWMKATGGVIIALLVGLFWAVIDLRTTLASLAVGG